MGEIKTCHECKYLDEEMNVYPCSICLNYNKWEPYKKETIFGKYRKFRKKPKPLRKV